MKRNILAVAAIFFGLLLCACGGSGNVGSNESVPAAGGGAEQYNQVFINSTSASKTMTVQLPIDVAGNTDRLVSSGLTVSIAFSNISTVIWNDSCKGWPGIEVKLSPQNKTVIPGINSGGAKGLWSVVEKGGRKSFFNINNIDISGAPFFIDKDTGLVYYGPATIKLADGTYAPNPDFKCPE